MSRRTFVIRDTDGRYYRSFCSNFFTTAHSDILVTDSRDISRARRFRFLWTATRRAKRLSVKSNGYYYVFEIVTDGGRPQLVVRNAKVIDKIRERDDDAMKEIRRIIEDWRNKRGLN